MELDVSGSSQSTAILNQRMAAIESIARTTAICDSHLRVAVFASSSAATTALYDGTLKGYESGATAHDLGARFGIDRRTVSVILKRHGVRMRRQGLSPEQVTEAVRFRAAGWTLARIGERLGVGTSTVKRRLAELRRTD